ncbi:hypothetical protein E3P86_02695 [Wallemia ichthyophaga]|uniref:Trafficking protein particle complex subunit 6B n=1 Tax=Wallemia ichthyophaga TaxID=245174 RepID=A0A4T0J0A6_WALIC|nr:hypothetical protein E3P86_02695 [Wallemia ichthyophaga]
MSKSSLNLNRNSFNLESSAEVDGIVNELLNIELINALRWSTEVQMRREEREITQDSLDDELISKLKKLGGSIGVRVAERISQGRGSLGNDLEVIKLLCKEIWTHLYGKQLDNLRTNHKGTYVLYDNLYKPLLNVSSSEANAARRLDIYLSTQVGIIQGCLSAFQLDSQVTYDINSLPGCTFQVKLFK